VGVACSKCQHANRDTARFCSKCGRPLPLRDAPQPGRIPHLRPGPPRLLIFALFVLSGATGLIYELVWTRELVFVFGGTTYAITTVLVAFMGGLGLGSYLAGRVSRRVAQPGRAYGLLEIAIGVYALCVPLLLHLAEPLYRVIYPLVSASPWPLNAARFLIGALVLLLPTTLMGATLPLLVRYLTLSGGPFGRWVAVLYGINTTGAVLGVVLCGFVLIPTLGLITTTRAAAATNVLIGLAAMLWLRRPQERASTGAVAPEKKAPDGARTAGASPASRTAGAPPARTAGASPASFSLDPLPAATRRAVLLVFAVSGFAAMVYQVCWSRALVMSIGSSTFSFTCILAAFIAGLSLGSYSIAPFVDRWRNSLLLIGMCELLIGVAAVAIMPIYGHLPRVVHGLVTAYGGGEYEKMIAWQFALIIAVTIVPTFLMGALFPLVTRSVVAGAEDEAAATGRAYGVNTLGTILGSFLAGFVLIRSDVLGVQHSILLASVLNGLAGALMIYLALPAASPALRLGPALAAVAPMLLIAGALSASDARAGPLKLAQDWFKWNPLTIGAGTFQGDDPDWKLRNFNVAYYGEGVDLTVTVGVGKEDPENLFLTVNAVDNASTGVEDMTTNLLLGHLPALLSQRNDNVCIIGLGCGVTLAAVARHPDVGRIDCVEISEEVIAGAELFAPFCYDVLATDGRVQMLRADGRNHLLLTDQKYDLIISEPSHPWMAGVANLFTREFFELCERRLAPDGRMCLWMHGYGLSRDNFRLILRTLGDVFGFVTMWELGPDDYMMIAGRAPFRVDVDRARARYETPAVREDLFRVSLGRFSQVLGRFLSSGDALLSWARDGDRGDTPPLHTDDNAWLEFTTPRQVYIDETYAIFAALNERRRSPFDELLTADAQNPAHGALVEEVGRVSKAWSMRSDASQARDRRPLAALERLLEAYDLDPGNLEIYKDAQELLAAALRQSALRESPTLRALAARFEAVPLPAGGVRRGQNTRQLVGQMAAYASTLAQRGHWKAAAYHLNQALELAPADPELLVKLVAALARAGQVDEAFARLRAAVLDGAFNPAELLEHRALRFLHKDPRFDEIRAPSASSP